MITCITSNMAYLHGCQCAFFFDNETLKTYKGYSDDEKLGFWRGYFDTNGNISKQPQQDVMCSLVISDNKLFEEFKNFVKVDFDTCTMEAFATGVNCVFFGINAMEFLGRIYKDVMVSPSISNETLDIQSITNNYTSNYAKYKQLMYCWTPAHAMPYDFTFKYKKTRIDAVAPSKAHITDTGYDLHLVEKVKEENGMVMYDTGIAVKPPHGYYFELVGRSSISKSGYIMANSVGIIDTSYRGSLKVALIKVNKDMPDLELPCRLVQLIPRQFLHLDAQEVDELDATSRGDGGFGSSG